MEQASSIITLSLIAVVCIIRFLIPKLKERKREKERRIREEQEFLKEKTIMTQRYGGRPISDFVEIPPDSEIGSDDLPRSKHATKFWGLIYTFYVSSTGKYHYSNCSYAKRKTPMNAYVLKNHSCFSPCEHCKPELPDMNWVDEYLKIKTIKERYNIDISETHKSTTGQL